MEKWTTASSYQGEVLSRLDEFRNDSLRKKSFVYTLWLVTALVLVISSFFLVRNMQTVSLPPLLMIYYVILTAHIIFRLRTGGKANILAPDIILVSFYTMFHMGYVTLFAFGLIEYSDKIIWSEESIPKAMLVINLGLVGFLLGYEMMSPRQNNIEYEAARVPTWYWFNAGIFLLAAGLAGHIACLFMIGIPIIMQYGYVVIANVARYSSAGLERMLWASNLTGIMGTIVCVTFSSLRHGKIFHSKLALTLTIVFALFFLLEGDRGYFVQMVMPIIIIRHYFVKKIPLSFFVIMMLFALTLMAGIGIVRNIVFDPSKMVKEYEYSRAAGIIDWRNPFIETGGSFKIPSLITSQVPANEPYWKGQSYISAAIRIIPFLDGVTRNLGLRGPPSYGASPAGWITYTIAGTEASGFGFSICAEGYLNFGYPGAFLELVVLGFWVRWLTVRFSRRPSAAWAIIMLGCLGASFMVTRNELQDMTSFCMQVFVLAGLLSMFCKNEQVAAYHDTEVHCDYGNSQDCQEMRSEQC